MYVHVYFRQIFNVLNFCIISEIAVKVTCASMRLNKIKKKKIVVTAKIIVARFDEIVLLRVGDIFFHRNLSHRELFQDLQIYFRTGPRIGICRGAFRYLQQRFRIVCIFGGNHKFQKRILKILGHTRI